VVFRSEVETVVQAPDWFPEWVGRMGGACWVCDPDGKLVHANAEAGPLLEGGALDQPQVTCHEALHGLDTTGLKYCRPDCRALQQARDGQPVDPFLLRLGSAGGAGTWFLVWVIPLVAPDGSQPWLVHTACNVDRFQRMEEYLREMAAQPARPGGKAPPPRRRLTAREAEILGLLAHGHDPQRIAARLFLSYATVRNHVEHILSKLGVHSIQQAVAWQLLQRGNEPGAPPPRRGATGADS